MTDFALSLGAFLLIALGLGLAFTQALAGSRALLSTTPSPTEPVPGGRLVSLLVDGAALTVTAVLAALMRNKLPEFWFVLTALLFLAGAAAWSRLGWISGNRRGTVTFAAQAVSDVSRNRGSDWVGFGARLVAFAALASFALLTRPSCPPCAGG